MTRSLVWALLAFLAAAEIEFISPKPGSKISGGSSIKVEWKKPAADEGLTSFQLFLAAGGDAAGEQDIIWPLTAKQIEFATGNTFEAVIPKTIPGASKPENA